MENRWWPRSALELRQDWRQLSQLKQQLPVKALLWFIICLTLESQTVSSIRRSTEVGRKFQGMAQFVLGVSICPNVVRFLLGGWDKEDEALSLDSMSGIAWN